MSSPQLYLITGASSGLGLHVARRLMAAGDTQLVLPVRSRARGDEVRRAMGAHAGALMLPVMNLASLRSVRDGLDEALAQMAGRRLDGVLLNAGVQSANRLEYTDDGFESTFAVNHLAHHLLAKKLLTHVKPGGRMGWTASGTHDPGELSARWFGFRGARYVGAARLARGEYEEGASGARVCRDAYATSKLCNIVSARCFAQTWGPVIQFFSFDPGLMPGTGLARQQPGWARAAWNHVLPHLVSVTPGSSSPRRSAAVLADLLQGRLESCTNGTYFDYRARQREPAAMATQAWIADDLMATSDALLDDVILGGVAPAGRSPGDRPSASP